MDIALIIISFILILLGIIGCIFPILPGPPLSFMGLILLQFTSFKPFSIETLLIFGILTIIVTVVDYIIPVIGTKFTGGTKYGNVGAIIGLIVGFFVFPIVGIILGPFIGAIVGEVIGGKKFEEAIKIGFGSLLGLLAGTFIKLAITIAMAVSYILKIINILPQL